VRMGGWKFRGRRTGAKGRRTEGKGREEGEWKGENREGEWWGKGSANRREEKESEGMGRATTLSGDWKKTPKTFYKMLTPAKHHSVCGSD